MGNVATPEFLIARWNELCREPALEDLPYKIELNSWGKVEMSPAGFRHGRLQIALGAELTRQLPDGVAASEVGILTKIGIRAPDVIWASARFMAAYGEISPLMRAPEICIEIVSPSNVKAEIDEKTRAYLAAGAEEVWIVTEDGTVHYFDNAGEKAKNSYPVTLILPPPIPRP